MSKNNIVLYSTCQGEDLAKMMIHQDQFILLYNSPKVIRSYYYIQNKMSISDDKEAMEAIKNADVFIYNPLNIEYNHNSTVFLREVLKPNCVSISMGFQYATYLWPLVKTIKRDVTDKWKIDSDESVILNTACIKDLILKGFNTEEILKKYDNDEIDFYYKERYRTEINLMKNKEKLLDVKTCEFIEKNIKDQRLFVYTSHPTFPLYVHMIKQIFNILGIKYIDNDYILDSPHLEMIDSSHFPTSAVKHFGFNFCDRFQENVANRFYKNVLLEYLNSIT